MLEFWRKTEEHLEFFYFLFKERRVETVELLPHVGRRGRAFPAANRNKVTDFLSPLAVKVTLEKEGGEGGGGVVNREASHCRDGRCGEPHSCLSSSLRRAADFLQPLRLSHVRAEWEGGWWGWGVDLAPFYH